MAETSTVIWHFTDGKAGHENQVKGLISAIELEKQIITEKITVPSRTVSFFMSLISGAFLAHCRSLPKPDYLVAAGRTTHLPMLIAKAVFTGQSILLMRSFWPYSWFNHIVIPEHDSPPKRTNILTTKGVLNNITPSDSQLEQCGAILIGGPSKHYHWDTASIVEQIRILLEATPTTHWTIANSRRTPPEFEQALHHLKSNIYTFVDHTQTGPMWLKNQLKTTNTIWVSPDSVSMLYESLTSGAYVGCFTMTPKSENRIVKGVNALIEDKMLTTFSLWQQTKSLSKPHEHLYEAQRAAHWILSQ